ncbi:MotA/TolQ/ExbB proton channel family protein [Paraferrimonas haliotis]|uniref:Flagellar motor protein MotA n=1 Tax=Paraferrimonas haliotis TaxID=2013866 RepID=A0AA37WX72_9GAMM|nr:MotA/TolQ/ExbB proton channel family protein [Paraferrimonas haliotis]GLS83875.1 flagellar motor protein MotA [Paraferrimonas haliotis]GLS84002.1 flagellar motor protein MotA [Paraferrimonas haliotis]
MKKLMTSALMAASLSLTAGMVSAADAPTSFDQLLNKVKSETAAQSKINKNREAEFKKYAGDKQALLNKAKRDLKAEQDRGDRLNQTYLDNERRLAELEEDRKNAQGDLGEMFGVVKGAAGNLASRLASSNISAQYPDRHQFIAELGARKELPRIDELEQFWMAYLKEMTESGKVVKFQGEVTGINGETVTTEVARVGPFNLLADGKFVIYNDELKIIQDLSQQPDSYQVSPIKNWAAQTEGYAPLYVDPASGVLLSVFTQKASLEERFEAGGTIGKIIAALLVLGLIIALERFVTLGIVGAKIKAQTKKVDQPGNNPLGRVLSAYQDNKNVDVETLELKLDEAILKETPALETRISILKVLAAIAPMLGLLGTVTGMIATFQSIQLFGTGDPKLMAGGISMALVTTVLGLIAALPLMLLHALVSARSKSLVQILEEQSAGIVAEHAEKRNA